MSDVAWASDRFVAVGGTTASTSPDGVAWTTVTVPGVPLDWGLMAVAPGGRGVVATAQADRGPGVWTSADGVAWVQLPTWLNQLAGTDPSGAVPADVVGGHLDPSGDEVGLVVVGSLPREAWRSTSAAAVWTSPSVLGLPDTLGPVPRPCPKTATVDILDLLDRSPDDREACFGSRTITFKAFVAAPLENGAAREVLLMPLRGEAGQVAFIDARTAPALAEPANYQWYVVAGRFDDKAAACPDGAVGEGGLTCDQLFVVTGLKPTAGP